MPWLAKHLAPMAALLLAACGDDGAGQGGSAGGGAGGGAGGAGGGGAADAGRDSGGAADARRDGDVADSGLGDRGGPVDGAGADGADGPLGDAAPDSAADAAPDAAPDSGSLLGAESFGLDFWVAMAEPWRSVLGVLEEDQVGMGLVGFQVNWERIEPSPPSGGVHSYVWSSIDPLFQAVADSGRVMDLGLMCRSEWATLVPQSAVPASEACCSMSPPREDADCDVAAYGMTCWQAWDDFVSAIVERYDGDGVDDAPWVTRRLIRFVELGDEPEVPAHFTDWGGTPELYARLLAGTYAAAKGADAAVLVARGKSNPGNIFDDAPDDATAMARRADLFQFLSSTLAAGEGTFDLFAINFNDHYTGLGPFMRWVEAEMQRNGYARSFMVADARTTLFPRDNDAPAPILPPRYPAGFLQTLRDPSHPDHAANKRLYQADEARQSLRKLLVAAAAGVEAFSVQPAFQMFEPPFELWREAGLFDYSVVLAGGDWHPAREPVYYALQQMLDVLLGADRAITALDVGPNVRAYRITRGSASTLALWHEDPFDLDAQGLVRRGQQRSVDLSPFVSTASVRVIHFVTDLSGALAPIYPPEGIVAATAVAIDETPVLVVESP